VSDALGDGCRSVVVRNEAHSDTFKRYETADNVGIFSLYCTDASTMPRLYDWLVYRSE
jgi:hypothetical protein